MNCGPAAEFCKSLVIKICNVKINYVVQGNIKCRLPVCQMPLTDVTRVTVVLKMLYRNRHSSVFFY